MIDGKLRVVQDCSDAVLHVFHKPTKHETNQYVLVRGCADIRKSRVCAISQLSYRQRSREKLTNERCVSAPGRRLAVWTCEFLQIIFWAFAHACLFSESIFALHI